MTVNDNTKYLAEVWIDNEEEEEFKKSFLNALIKQYMGHGNGFDADTVDGMHGWEIEEYINEITEDFITTFSIGDTQINNESGGIPYYLGFEAIKLYNPALEDVSNDKKKLPWSNELCTNPKEVPNLHWVINKLFELTYAGDLELGTIPTNKSLYEDLLTEIESINLSLKTIQDVLRGKIKNGLLNADSVNGLRFFIYTQEQYNRLKENAEKYEAAEEEGYEQYEGDYKKINSIHNVFIIKTEEEIKREYESGVYDGNPDIAVINQLYKFRVAESEENGVQGKYLQYTHEDVNVGWRNICLARDFIDREAVHDDLKDILQNEDDYVLNPSVVKTAINNIPITDETDLPMVNYGRQNFLKGAFYNYIDQSHRTDIPTISIGKFQYLNLSPFYNELSGQTQNVLNDLNGYKTLLQGQDGNSGIIGELRNNISSLRSGLTTIKGGSSKSIKNLEDSITAISNRLQVLEDTTIPELVTNIGKWEYYLDMPEFAGTRTDYDMQLLINKTLKLVYVRVTGQAKGDGVWANTKARIAVKKFCPISRESLLTHIPNIYFRVIQDEDENYGVIQYYSKAGATAKKPIEFAATGMFKYGDRD